ncbi:uncharacterized protein LOC125074046 [Vanessa atalanta]|uniref:uncharacterized protein LOC125074046 n=1 Tax=Vanessa atalanta TaxID=42275 RepID=UPI001FCD4BA3|nr:uncharacterized protein LOC125074046 [Vanessa atalanta]
MYFLLVTTSIMLNIYLFEATPQPDGYNPEINDQFEKTTTSDDKPYKSLNSNVIDENNEILDKEFESHKENKSELAKVENTTPVLSFYKKITFAIQLFLCTPKIKSVLTNIGTCIVNGVMEIVSFYLPAPLIPLLASAAGMIIPFEPVVMLRRQMPVTSYRRALKTAVNGFLNTFNVYKYDNDDEDPYMTRRFNRRFMDGPKDEVNTSKPFDE